MQRFSVMSAGAPIDQLESIARRFGGRNVKVATRVGQVICEFDTVGLLRIQQEPGVIVRPIGQIGVIPEPGVQQIRAPVEPRMVGVRQPIYAMSQVQLSSLWYELREATSPPSIGEEITIAILDTGIRKTHRGLENKVIYEQNFTSSPTVDDVFSHGTGVAFMAVGGQHAAGQEAGIAPGGKVMNFKVIGDDGQGTVESLILALDTIADMKTQSVDSGKTRDDPMFIDAVNLSVGTEDDGDPNNPLRVAIKAITDAPEPYGSAVYAAAGNSGPGPGTILLPASMPEVYAIGVVTFSPLTIWSYSSRGPAKDGTVKPDMCLFGVNIVTAGSAGDEAFEIKSGTSFSCPCVCAGALGLQMMFFKLGLLSEVRHKSVAENLPILQLFSVKPSDAESQTAKDNTYGVGIPYGGRILQALTQGVGPMQIVSVMLPVMGMAMMIPALKGMISSMK